MKVAIIGGGIVGLATAYKLHKERPDFELTVLEKERDVGKHQTGNNSGVLHSGIYYKPGSLKAALTAIGLKELITFSHQNSIPYEQCGKLIIAKSEDELPTLKNIFDNGRSNGLENLKLMSLDEAKHIEPNIAGTKALWVPQTGIIDYNLVCRSLAEIIRKAGGSIRLGFKVSNLKYTTKKWLIYGEHPDELIEVDYFINCAGLHCDQIAKKSDVKIDVQIVPFRGEYYNLVGEAKNKVKGLIYPVPNPKFPFLGVHLTKMIDGSIEAGPNAILALSREGYKKTNISLKDATEILTYRGFWLMGFKHWRSGIDELFRSFSKSLFLKSIQELVPNIESDDIVPGGAGVRAQAIKKDGTMVGDFLIKKGQKSFHVLNAPSPAATASLAIGEYVVKYFLKQFSV